jgi:hypothetical protein
MPRLPTAEQLGERPVLRPATGVASYSPDPLGEAVKELGSDMTYVSEKIKEEELKLDKMQVHDAVNRMRQERLDLMRGDDGYLKKTGKDALDSKFMPDYTKRLSSKVEGISGTLTNPRQREMFKMHADPEVLGFQEGILQHSMREREVFDKQTVKNTVDDGLQDASLNYKNPGVAYENMARIKDVIESSSLRDEEKKALMTQSLSALHTSVIQQYMAKDEGDMAEAYFKTHRKEIVDDGKIGAAVEISSTRKWALTTAQGLFDKTGGNGKAMLEQVGKITDVRKKEELRKNIHQMLQDKELGQKQATDELFATAQQYIKDGKELPPEVEVRVQSDPGVYKAITAYREFLKNPTTENDDKAWNEFNRKYDDRTRLADMPEIEYWGYMTRLDEPHRERLASLRDAAIEAAKGNKDAKNDLRNDLTLKQMVLGRIVDAGLIAGNKKAADYTSEDETIIYGATERASSLIEQRYGKKATVEQKREIVNSLVLENVKAKVKGSGFFGFFDKQKKTTEMTPEEKGAAYFDFKSVPLTSRDALRQMAAEAGIKDVNDDNIARAYTVFMQTSGLPRADREKRIIAILRGEP